MPGRRIKRPRTGDVFEMVLANGHLGYGVVVIAETNLYVIVLAPIYSKRPPLEELSAAQIALVGWTMDAFFHHGRWEIVYDGYPSRNDIPFPNGKVEIEGQFYLTDFAGSVIAEATADQTDLLDFETSRSPIGFQKALEAIHGLQPWKDHFGSLTVEHNAKRVVRKT